MFFLWTCTYMNTHMYFFRFMYIQIYMCVYLSIHGLLWSRSKNRTATHFWIFSPMLLKSSLVGPSDVWALEAPTPLCWGRNWWGWVLFFDQALDLGKHLFAALGSKHPLVFVCELAASHGLFWAAFWTRHPRVGNGPWPINAQSARRWHGANAGGTQKIGGP